MGGTHWSELIRERQAGRRHLLVDVVMAGLTGQVTQLVANGALRPMTVAAVAGVGSLPDAAAADTLYLPVESGDTMASLRAVEAVAKEPPAELRERVDAWDPDGAAVALVSPLFTDGVYLGRPSYGARPGAWVQWEDKLRCDEVWDAALVARAPQRIVPIAVQGLARAAAELDRGDGTVWAGDNRDGWHGGAERTRWVPGPDGAAAAAADLAANCDRVRVMPFLEGLPCSIHGLVVGEAVITGRPVEMLVLRSPARGKFWYVGSGTFWDPPPAHRAAMREVARAVGQVLRRESGYRGGFTVDGIMTAQGFVPTELNPRLGPGLSRAVARVPDLPLLDLHRAMVAGEVLDYRPRDLERAIVDGADARRNASAFLSVPAAPDLERTIGVTFRPGGGCRRAEPGGRADAVAVWGSGITGGVLSVAFDSDAIAPGWSVAGRTADAMLFAGEHLGLDVGPFEPAVDVFARPR
jgi:hypothetical protein